MLTYSQADEERFPSRRSFADAVLDAFSRTPAQILQWVCPRENHSNGGIHYHMAVKLDRNHHWLRVRNALQNCYDIHVNFSSRHYNYFSAWSYVTKEDRDFLQSEGHPDLQNTTPPRTNAACISNARCRNDNADEDDHSSTQSSKKKKRLSSFKVSEMILEKKIKSRTELLAFAQLQKEEGKSDLAEFIVNRGPRVITQVLDTAWEMAAAPETLARQNNTRLEILGECLQRECAPLCNSQWYVLATELLQRNGITLNSFQDSVKELLEKGRGKNRNVLIVGPANCGKTFILNPLTKVYHAFCNPASSTFAWIGAEQAECIFLNDFRWSEQIIAWHDFLLLLEGQLVHLPAPKTYYAQDIVFEKDTPIFCTSKVPFVYIKRGIIDERETEMMSVRWRVYTFNHQIPAAQQVEVPPCPKCFARLVLDRHA